MATSKILFGKDTTFPTSLTQGWTVIDVQENSDSVQNVIDNYAGGNAEGGVPHGNLSGHTSENAVVISSQKRDYFDGSFAYFFMNGDHYQEYIEGTRAFKDIQHTKCYQLNKAFLEVNPVPYPPVSGYSDDTLVSLRYGNNNEIVEITCFIGRMYGNGTVTAAMLVSDIGNPRTRTNVLTEQYTIETNIMSTYLKTDLESEYGFNLSSWGQETSRRLAKVVITAPEGESIDPTKTFYIGFCLKSDAENTEDTDIIRTRACYRIKPEKMANPDGTYSVQYGIAFTPNTDLQPLVVQKDNGTEIYVPITEL